MKNNRSQSKTIELPDCAPDQVAIRTYFSGVSVGTEFALIRGKLSWKSYPLCTGYQGTGVVETVGSAIDNFSVGDEVYYRGNDNMALADGTEVGSVTGAHCSHIVTKPNTTHGVAQLPKGAPPDVACMYVMPAVGLNGVDMANPRMGQTAVVYGCGLIGLGVIAFCAQRGCTVIAVDINEKRLAVAKTMGADQTMNAAEAEKEIGPEGADIVFESTGLPECVDPAIALCRTHGSFVWQGNYGKKPITMNFLRPHGRRLQMFFPCDDGLQPCRRAVVKSMANGSLNWEPCISHRISFAEAPAMFQRINEGDTDDIIGVVINWQT